MSIIVEIASTTTPVRHPLDTQAMPIVAEHVSYSISDFVNWQRDGTLDLRPPFQRRAVWRPTLKSSLIDSLLRGFPIPALFLQDRTDARSFRRRLVVVDGQQRLRTILSFIDVSCLPDADERDRFSILRIHDESRAGMGYGDLSEADKDVIASARLSVFVVPSAISDSQLLEIFRRMNTYGARLNPQELRNAEFSGMFKEVAYRLAADLLDAWITWGLFNRQQIAEMRDAEFVSDVLLLTISGTQAGTKQRLDKAYQDWDENFPWAERSRERVLHLTDILDHALTAVPEMRRLATRMWIYSLFDALQQVVYSAPLCERSTVRARTVPARRLIDVLARLNERIVQGSLPEAVSRATRGAASDRGSREIRAQYLVPRLRRCL